MSASRHRNYQDNWESVRSYALALLRLEWSEFPDSPRSYSQSSYTNHSDTVATRIVADSFSEPHCSQCLEEMKTLLRSHHFPYRHRSRDFLSDRSRFLDFPPHNYRGPFPSHCPALYPPTRTRPWPDHSTVLHNHPMP